MAEEIIEDPEVPTQIKMQAGDLIADINAFQSAGVTLLTTAKTVDQTVSTVQQAEQLVAQAPEAVRFGAVETRVYKATEALSQTAGLPAASKQKLKSILKTVPKPEPVAPPNLEVAALYAQIHDVVSHFRDTVIQKELNPRLKSFHEEVRKNTKCVKRAVQTLREPEQYCEINWQNVAQRFGPDQVQLMQQEIGPIVAHLHERVKLIKEIEGLYFESYVLCRDGDAVGCEKKRDLELRGSCSVAGAKGFAGPTQEEISKGQLESLSATRVTALRPYCGELWRKTDAELREILGTTKKDKEKAGKAPLSQIIATPSVSPTTKAIASEVVTSLSTVSTAKTNLVQAAQAIAPSVVTVEEAKQLAQQLPTVLEQPVAMLVDAQDQAIQATEALAKQPDVPSAKAILRDQFIQTYGQAEGKRVQYEYNRILSKIDSGADVTEDTKQLAKLVALRAKLNTLHNQFAGEQALEDKLAAFREEQSNPALSLDQVIANYRAAIPLYTETLRLYKIYLAEVAPLRPTMKTEYRNQLNEAIKAKLFAGQLENLEAEIHAFAKEQAANFPVKFGKDVECLVGKYSCLQGAELVKLLGQGAYGATYNACVNENCQYVIKVQRHNAEYLNEITVYQKLKDWPGIKMLNSTTCEGICGKDGNVPIGIIVLEKWDGDLKSDQAWANALTNLGEFVQQLGEQIRYLHGTAGYIHWDIQRRNVLYKGTRFTIVDFGVANSINTSVPFGYTDNVSWLRQQFNIPMSEVFFFLKNTLELAEQSNWFLVDYYLVMYAILVHPSLDPFAKKQLILAFLQQQHNTAAIIDAITVRH